MNHPLPNLKCSANPRCDFSAICVTLKWARRGVLLLALLDLGIAAWRAQGVMVLMRDAALHHNPILASQFIFVSLAIIVLRSIITIVSAGVSTTVMQRVILRLKQLNDDVCLKGP